MLFQHPSLLQFVFLSNFFKAPFNCLFAITQVDPLQIVELIILSCFALPVLGLYALRGCAGHLVKTKTTKCLVFDGKRTLQYILFLIF